MSLKKELQEAIDALEAKEAPSENKKLQAMRSKGQANKAIKSKFQIKGWCFAGDHPIIDVSGGE